MCSPLQQYQNVIINSFSSFHITSAFGLNFIGTDVHTEPTSTNIISFLSFDG